MISKVCYMIESKFEQLKVNLQSIFSSLEQLDS